MPLEGTLKKVAPFLLSQVYWYHLKNFRIVELVLRPYYGDFYIHGSG